MSNSLWAHGPLLSPRVCSNSCLFSQWCYLTISFSAVPFSFCLTSFPASGSFQISWFFTLGGQRIGASVSESWIFWKMKKPCNEYSGLISFRTDLFGLLAGQRTLKSTTVQKHQFFGNQLSLWFNSHIHTWLLEKPQLWLYRPLSSQWCLCFLICCLVCHSFPYKDQASFNSMAAVTIHSDFVAQENKVCHCFHCFPIYLP